MRRKLFVDLFGLGGLASMGVGLWWKDPAWSLICIGAVAFMIAVYGARHDSKHTS